MKGDYSMKIFVIMKFIFIILFAYQNIIAQVSWTRSEEITEPPLQLFHSTQVVNLPTAETLQKGDLEFEISHRFLPTINEGIKSLYGFDGPVNIRLALAYALTNDLVTTLGRSNVDDNLELRLKYKLYGNNNEYIPFLIGLQGGMVWNTDPAGRDASDSRNFQYYAQVIFNTLVDKKLGLGIVPSYLYNSHIYCPDNEYSLTLGTYLQYYFSSLFSIMSEWNPTLSGFRNKYDSFSFGFELETGGHFFKIILTNNSLLNPAQFIGGSDLPITMENWRIGFNITRLLKF